MRARYLALNESLANLPQDSEASNCLLDTIYPTTVLRDSQPRALHLARSRFAPKLSY